jgi:hypothetical protein
LNQLIHTDVDPDNSLFFGEPHMWIGILGLEDCNYMRVLKYSHMKSRTEKTNTSKKKNPKVKPREDTKWISVVQYNKYQYIIQHPQLAHGGYGSLSKRGFRLHGFHGFPESFLDTTYLVDFKLFTERDHLNKIK